jgi:hypothetical protein
MMVRRVRPSPMTPKTDDGSRAPRFHWARVPVSTATWAAIGHGVSDLALCPGVFRVECGNRSSERIGPNLDAAACSNRKCSSVAGIWATRRIATPEPAC